MEQNDVAEDDWKATVDEDGLDGVQGERGELEKLKLGEVLLPPEVWLHLGTQGGKEVVRVHDGVDAHVQEPAESRVTSAHEFNSPPSSEGHDSMVNHVESGEVAVLLPQHEEEGVEVVHVLGEVVPPSHVQGVQRSGVIGVVHGLAIPVVFPAKPY